MEHGNESANKTDVEQCFFCHNFYDVSDVIEDRSGERFACDECASERCFTCGFGECEVETPRGEYVCSDCYSGQIDDARGFYDD